MLLTYSSGLSDYVIESADTVRVSIAKGEDILLNEQYSPDRYGKIHVRDFGKVCAQSLYSKFENGMQENLCAEFRLLVNGSARDRYTIVPARERRERFCYSPILLTSATERSTSGEMQQLSVFAGSGDTVSVTGVSSDRTQNTAVLPSLPYRDGVRTFSCTLSDIQSTLGVQDLVSYTVRAGNSSVLYRVDKRKGIHYTLFHYLNNFRCPELLVAKGLLTVKCADKSDAAYINGSKRKMSVTPADEYTVNSGPLGGLTEYRAWRDLINSERVLVSTVYGWRDIVINKSNATFSMDRSRPATVEFTFEMADPADNGEFLLEHI